VATGEKINGTVKDSAGAPVANAAVTFTGGSLRQSKTVRTSSTGAYDSNWIAGVNLFSCRFSKRLFQSEPAGDR
jgi:hypothetical protein